jgi:hypothetical protein
LLVSHRCRNIPVDPGSYLAEKRSEFFESGGRQAEKQACNVAVVRRAMGGQAAPRVGDGFWAAEILDERVATRAKEFIEAMGGVSKRAKMRPAAPPAAP